MLFDSHVHIFIGNGENNIFLNEIQIVGKIDSDITDLRINIHTIPFHNIHLFLWNYDKSELSAEWRSWYGSTF